MGALIAISLGNSAIKILGGLLKGHTERLQGATSENSAAAQLAPSIQNDLQGIAQEYSSGSISSDDAISLVEQLDQQVYTYAQQQLGKPGTAWSADYNGPITNVSSNPQVNLGQGVGCNKTCTVLCCIYYNSWKPAFTAMVALLGTGKSFSVTVAQMQSNKYGFPGFPAYTIQVPAPPVASITNILSKVTDAADLLTGQKSPSGSPSTGTTSNTKTFLLVGLAALGSIFLLTSKKRESA